MSIQPDSWIRRMAREEGMIEPFSEQLVKTGISFGTTSYGYDMRLSNEFRLLKMDVPSVMDPKNLDPTLFDQVVRDVLELQPHSMAIGRSVEYFRIPRQILTICFGKSTYARCGVLVNVTPFEPEWEGFVTISMLNASPLPVRIYANEGIAQVIFLKAETACEMSYRDRKGKYQAQQGIVYSKVDKEQ